MNPRVVHLTGDRFDVRLGDTRIARMTGKRAERRAWTLCLRIMAGIAQVERAKESERKAA